MFDRNRGEQGRREALLRFRFLSNTITHKHIKESNHESI